MEMSRQGPEQAAALLSQLKLALSDRSVPSQERQKLLERLKVLGRNPANAAPIFAKEGIETLATYAFDSGIDSVSREAMRCLANAMLLDESTRQTLLSLGYDVKASQRLQSDDRDDEFLASRIIFYMTYTRKLDIKTLIDKHDLATNVTQHLKRHAGRYDNKGSSSGSTDPMEKMSLEETLKLLYNVLYYEPDSASKFAASLPPIITILNNIVLPSPTLQPPVTLLINALMNLELDLTAPESSLGNPVFPDSDSRGLIDRLIHILDLSLKSSPTRELDQTLSPLITLLRRIHEIAPEQTKSHLRSLLLPSKENRDKPIGQDETLPSRLLRLTNSPLLPMLRDSVSAFFFEMSDKDASTFIQNIGYGYAAGFLSMNKIAVPESAMGGASVSDDGDRVGVDKTSFGPRTGAGLGPRSGSGFVNPVTGQRRDAEPEDMGPEMTDEEKIREAERLFVLFERLRATGVVDVENPIRRAVEEGRFEEIE